MISEEAETQMVWPHLKNLLHGKHSSAGDSERSKKEKKIGRKRTKWTVMGFGIAFRAAEDRDK